MNEIFPVCIASKNRHTGKTMQLLRAERVPFTLFVEPQDASVYRQHFDWDDLVNVTVIPDDDRGLPYVRQVVLDDMVYRYRAAPARGPWFWLLDDDIDNFFVTRDKKTHKVSVREALAGAQEVFANIPDVAQAGLEYQQFAWSATKPAVFNSYCDVAVCINVERSGLATFRPETDLKCDRDFTLQLISQGYRVAKVQQYSFSAPKNGSNAGGLKEAYAVDGREAASSAAMVRLWPGVCQYKPKPDGRPDVKINWRAMQS